MKKCVLLLILINIFCSSVCADAIWDRFDEIVNSLDKKVSALEDINDADKKTISDLVSDNVELKDLNIKAQARTQKDQVTIAMQKIWLKIGWIALLSLIIIKIAIRVLKCIPATAPFIKMIPDVILRILD